MVTVPNRHAFALWLNAILGSHRVSATSLAQQLELPVATVRAWLVGESAPTEDECLAIADALASAGLPSEPPLPVPGQAGSWRAGDPGPTGRADLRRPVSRRGRPRRRARASRAAPG